MLQGKPNLITDPNGQTTNITYDPLGRVNEVIYAGTARKATTNYNACIGCSANGATISYFVDVNHAGDPDQKVYFDKLNRVVRIKTQLLTGSFSVVDTVYDSAGRVDKVSQPYIEGTTAVWVDYEIDHRRRLTNVVLPGGGNQEIEYTTDGNSHIRRVKTTTTKPALTSVNAEYRNAQGQLDHVVNAEGTLDNVEIEYDYTANGWMNWIKVNDDAQALTEMTYNRAGHRKSITEPNSGTTTFTPDALGNVKTQTNDGKTITWIYDVLDRVTSRDDNGVANSWEYDTATKGVGFLKSKTTNGFTETYSYDSLSRLSNIATSIDYEHGTASFTLGQTYDTFDRPLKTIYPSGLAINRNYLNGSQNKITNDSGGTVLHEVIDVSSYGGAKQERLNDTFLRDSVYDGNNGRLTNVTQANLSTLEYDWRAHGSLRSRKTGSVEEIFDYDDLDRLTGANVTNGRSLSYDYDALGNINFLKNQSGSTDATNNMIYNQGTANVNGLYQADVNGITNTLGYDGGGNVTSILSSLGDKTFIYDAQNRATSITYADVVNGTEIQSFKYEPDGQRFYKKDSVADEHTFYLYSGAFQETRIGTAVTGYQKTQVSESVQHTESPTGTEEFLYFRRDHLGSIETITDGAGVAVDTLAFDPFGARRQADWSGPIIQTELDEILNAANGRTRRGFTDHEHLDRVEVVHMNGRIYDARLGRFLNVDPIVQAPGNSQNFNRYSYVLNSPLSFVDPSGFDFTDVGGSSGSGSDSGQRGPGAGIGDDGGAQADAYLKRRKAQVGRTKRGQRFLANLLEQSKVTMVPRRVPGSNFIISPALNSKGNIIVNQKELSRKSLLDLKSGLPTKGKPIESLGNKAVEVSNILAIRLGIRMTQDIQSFERRIYVEMVIFDPNNIGEIIGDPEIDPNGGTRFDKFLFVPVGGAKFNPSIESCVLGFCGIFDIPIYLNSN